VTFDTNRPLRGLLDFLAEMERTITYALQFEFTDSEGLEPDAPLPQLEAPNAGGVNIQFGLGELSNYEHFARPYIVWTLGDTKQRGALHRGSRGIVNPRPFKQTLDLVTCTMYGANIDNSDRGTVTGCERLRWCFYWALREHWGGDPEFEREGWLEVPGNNQVGYAFVSAVRVPFSQMRPAILQTQKPPAYTLEFKEPTQ